MSKRYIGNSPPEPSGPEGPASGIWKLEEVLFYIREGLWTTSYTPPPPIEKGSLSTGIAETYYNVGNHYKTSDSGVSWQTIGTTFESYGGISSGDAFMHVSSGGIGSQYFSADLLTSNNMTGGSSTGRYFKSIDGTLMRQQNNNLQKSYDNGLTWVTKHTRSPTSSFSNGFHYGDGVWFHSYTETNTEPRTVYYLISLNNGETWTSSGITGLPTSSDNFSGHSIYLNGAHYFNAPDNNLYTSTNGLTWSFLATNQIATKRNNYGQGGLNFYREPHFYGINGRQMYRSLSYGSGWATFGNLIPEGNSSTKVGYINGNFVVMGSEGSYANTAIYTSSDNGATWTTRLSVVGNPNNVAVYGINQYNP